MSISGRVLVTGATGCTGRALCRRLASLGLDVNGWGTRAEDEELTSWGVNYQAVDISDRDQVEEAFDSVDYVFHLAAAYRKEEYDRDVFRRVNIEGTRHLLEASVRADIKRFVHTSTVGVQGEIKSPPATENHPLAPGDHYQRSKLEGEQLALDFFNRELEGVVVRPVGIYGPGDLRFLKLFKAIQKKRFVMIGNGEPLYHLTYIEDLIDGLLLAAVSPQAVGEVFTLAGPRYTSLWEFVEMISEVLAVPKPRWSVPYTPVYLASILCEFLGRIFRFSPPLYPRRVEFFKLDRAFSIAKAELKLNYRPKVDLAEGLARTAQWYRDQGYLSSGR